MNFPSSPVVAAAMVATVSAALPDHELTPDIARKVAALSTGEFPERLTIALILNGSTSGTFDSDNARRAIVIHAVSNNGPAVRKAETYTFIWNAEYGWFIWQIREDHGGDTIHIFSETKGEVVIK